MNSNRIPVVLVGLGRMGSNHLRVIKDNPSFDLKAVLDVKLPDTFATANPGIAGYTSREELDAADVAYDAVVIAAPTGSHYEIARHFLARDKHLLVEKPLASTIEQCRTLIDEAKKRNLILGVGHVERFNPAVRKLHEVIENGWLDKPIHFSVTRVGGYPQTILPGNNVMLDLAVHDVDVLQSLIGPLTVVASIVHNTVRSDIPDTAEILLKNDEGVSASIHVNWITPTKIRTIRVTGTRGVCFVDYILQTCTLMGGNLLSHEPTLKTDFQNLIRQYQNTDKIEFGIQNEEPLKVQLRAFHKALTGDPSELCSGEDGARAVEVSLRALSYMA
jgi:UDP-N-acetylglucosamine 3-dehydrogenase